MATNNEIFVNGVSQGTQQVSEPSGFRHLPNEERFYAVLNAKLDPDAYVMYGDWPITTDRDLWAVGAWNLSIGGNLQRRLDIRENPALFDPGLMIPSGTTLGQNQDDGGRSMLLAVDPSAVDVAHSREQFFERIMRLSSLQIQRIQHSLESNTTDYRKLYAGKSFCAGRPAYDSDSRTYETLVRTNTNGASNTLRVQGYGHTAFANTDVVNVRLWLQRQSGYSGDITVKFTTHSGLAPTETALSNTVTVSEANLPVIGAGPQPVDVQLTMTGSSGSYPCLQVQPESGSGNCVDWLSCFGIRASTQTNIAAKIHNGSSWVDPSNLGTNKTFAFHAWEDNEVGPDTKLMLTSGMCYNGAWINLYGHTMTNGLAVFHEISDADPFRHGNVFYRVHDLAWGDMMGLLRDNTTLPARGQLTWVELPSNW